MNVYRFLSQWVTWQFPPEDYVRWGWWMLSMPILLFILLGAPFYIALQSEGSKGRAIRAAISFAVMLLGADIAYYAEGAYLRATVPEQRCNVEGPSPDGLYDAMVCVTGGSVGDTDTEGFVQLRSRKNGAILAEREFYNPEFTRVRWTPDSLSVGLADGSADFSLPPSWLDGLRARLP